MKKFIIYSMNRLNQTPQKRQELNVAFFSIQKENKCYDVWSFHENSVSCHLGFYKNVKGDYLKVRRGVILKQTNQEESALHYNSNIQ